MNDALNLLESRLIRRQRIAESVPAKAADDWSRDFAEILRHELNNPLTGILGNAELLLAEIAGKKDGKLPHGGLERVETIAALAVRMRETVRQLSHEWETRNDPVRQSEAPQIIDFTRLALFDADSLIANGCPCDCRHCQVQDQERNSTDSRWNIFTAINIATPPYTQVERKIRAIEFQ